MSPHTFRELECWRLADELRRAVDAICRNPKAAADSRFCANFRDAAGSVCRNLAEGFARYRSGDIVQFFTYALASLAEVMDALTDCRARGLIEEAEAARLDDLANHVKATSLNFMRPHKRKVEARERQKRPSRSST